MRFQNKVVLITGGAAGIGKACAAKFAAEGAVVLICDVNEEVGQATAQEIGASFYKVNVADRQDVQRWVDAVVAAHGRIDVLINNAGILRDGQLVKMKDGKVVKQMSEADWDLLIDINLKGVFNCTQAVAPVMINQGGGVILNASSIVGLDGNFGQTNYVAAKAGVIGMTKVWARELGRYGIRVNAIAPGFTLTDMVRQMPAEILQNMAARVPLGRLGEVADIANAYAFLASAEASYISGVTLRVDGGIVVGT
ncbi:MAG: 3-oxoacyl-ACP reductase FabG [Caldilineales bacterium]|nr:3-oxoacyl-ACP reductase FabG [Caldilineales bacterium]